MARINAPLLGFNGGEISHEALVRTDLERVRFGAEVQSNFLPRALGGMSLRPGTQYLGSTRINTTAQLIPFVFNADDTALLELTNLRLRIWDGGSLISATAVGTTITNPTFSADLSGWEDADDDGCRSWFAGGDMQLLGTGDRYARRRQEVNVAGADQGTRHTLRVVVERGPVEFRVGSTATNDNYVAETTLRTGTHYLSFTPTDDFWIVVQSADPVHRRVASIDIAPDGVFEVPTPWAASAVGSIRHVQSGDVIFCAHKSARQQRIERRNAYSWSVCEYAPDDGPFRRPSSARISLKAAGVYGNTTLSASSSYFRSSMVGSLIRLTMAAQCGTAVLAASDSATNPIRVVERSDGDPTPNSVDDVVITITEHVPEGGDPDFNGTIELQRSFGTPDAWETLDSWTEADLPVSEVYNSNKFPNEVIYYRLAIPGTVSPSGAVKATIKSTTSSQVGIARITEYNSTTSVDIEVLKPLGAANTGTFDWREGTWSDRRGYPSSVAFHDGRLFWGAGDTLFGSISDAFDSFDPDFEGDAGPIVRSVSNGPTDGIYWLASAARLLAGCTSQEVSVRSSSFDEPLTPTAFTSRVCSTVGSANLDVALIDTGAIFVQRDRRRVFLLSFDANVQDYVPTDLTRLNPEICSARVKAVAVQRQPETRVWFVLDDGEARVLTYDAADNVAAWSTVTTDGLFEDVTILPGADEDEVYFVVNRTPEFGSTARYVERMAKQREAIGGTTNKIADAFTYYTGAATATLTGLDHLEGRSVVVWAGGQGIYDQENNLGLVIGGELPLPSAMTNVVVGLPYSGLYRSMKLAFGAEFGTALLQPKRVDHLGAMLRRTNWKALRVGRDFDHMTRLPLTYKGKVLAETHRFDEWDDIMFSFPGIIDTDARICIEARAPYAASITGLVVSMVVSEKGDFR